MANSETKRALRDAYKSTPLKGGVYQVRNRETGRVLLMSTTDLQGSRNRFAFSVKLNSCPYLKVAADWAQYGAGAFVLEVLEPLDQGDTQTYEEFQEDIKVLHSLWKEKLGEADQY